MTFMETEARNKEPPIPIEKSQLRTVAASEVSRLTAQEIKGGTSSLDAAEVRHSRRLIGKRKSAEILTTPTGRSGISQNCLKLLRY
jgi:hypothetical protein